MMKSSHIGLHHPEFFLHWAAFELQVGKWEISNAFSLIFAERKDKALSVLNSAEELPLMRGNGQLKAAKERIEAGKELHLDALYKLNTELPPTATLTRTYSATLSDLNENMSNLRTPSTFSIDTSLDEKLAKLRKIGLGPPKRHISETETQELSVAKEKENVKPLQKQPEINSKFLEVNENSTMSLTMTEGIVIRKDSQPDTLTFTAIMNKEESVVSSSAIQTSTSANNNNNSNVKSRQVRVNGKIYRVLQLIGRGGSSKVFRVINGDGQIYALKKVNLKNLDDSTVHGYANEIQLLRKFANNPHIIQLIDSEMNRESGYLYLLMEYGEVDLGRMLKTHNTGEGADRKIDENFIRFSWQQVRAIFALTFLFTL